MLDVPLTPKKGESPCNTEKLLVTNKKIQAFKLTMRKLLIAGTLGLVNKIICCCNRYSFNYSVILQREGSSKVGFLLP